MSLVGGRLQLDHHDDNKKEVRKVQRASGTRHKGGGGVVESLSARHVTLTGERGHRALFTFGWAFGSLMTYFSHNFTLTLTVGYGGHGRHRSPPNCDLGHERRSRPPTEHDGLSCRERSACLRVQPAGGRQQLRSHPSTPAPKSSPSTRTAQQDLGSKEDLNALGGLQEPRSRVKRNGASLSKSLPCVTTTFHHLEPNAAETQQACVDRQTTASIDPFQRSQPASQPGATMSHHASRRASESQKRSSWDPEPLSPALPRSASSMASRDIPTRRPFPASPDFTTAAAAPDRLSTQQAQPSSSSVSVSHARSASQVRSTTNTTNWPNPPPKLGAAHPKWLLTALARPFYLLSRRGPAVPLFLVLSILLVLFLNQSSGSAPITTDLDPSSSEPRLAARPDELYAHIPPDRVAQPNAAAGLNRAGQGRVKGRLDKLKEIPGAQWAWEAGSRWAGLQHGTDQSSSSREGFLDDAEVGEEDPLWVPKGGGDSSSHKGRPDAGAAGVAEGGLFEGTDRAAALLSSGGKTRRRDGRLLIVEGQEHPIPRLIERAKRRWRKLNDKQSKTFTQAVREYMRRYGRNPPKGFDQWFVPRQLAF